MARRYGVRSGGVKRGTRGSKVIGKTFEKDEHGAYYVENLACGHNGRVLALDESMGVYRWCRECPIVQPASAPKRATS